MKQKETKTEELLSEDIQEEESELEDITLYDMPDSTDSEEGIDPSKPQLYKKGEEWTGNKNGRPKGVRNTKTLFREAFEAIAASGNITDPEKDLFITLLAKAQKGDMKAMRMFLEYRFGKPTQSLELKAEVNNGTEQIQAMEDMLQKVITAKQASEE